MTRISRPHAKIEPDDPLANRLVEGLIRRWVNTSLAFADATAADEAIRKGVQHTAAHLDEFWIHLVPDIVDNLRRAGLLKGDDPAAEGKERSDP